MNEENFAAEYDGTEVAIVGMAGRFPGAANLDEFWRNIRDGVDSIRPLTDEEARAAGATEQQLQNPAYIKVNSAMDEIDRFDADFFGYNPRDAEIMDPQQRVFLESAWTALEHAGYDPAQYRGLIGVFAGSTTSSYLVYNLATNPQLLNNFDQGQIDIGNGADFLSTRVSYKFNLRGPSFTVQTACSTSLVAVHLACQALLGDECDMALAGGVAVHVDHPKGYQFTEGSILSPDGRTRTYDADTIGTVFSSGVGVVVLKRLEDALNDGDHIHAIIRGSAVNNDGSDKVGFPAPGVDGQAAVITEALAVSGVDAESIQYIEGHGSGTRLGDPIEIRALTKAFRTYTDKTGFCPIGSVKTNVGHLTGAAGIAGLIKTILALEHQEIPPSLHFETPNPEIDFANAPVYPNASLQPWATPANTPRRAGVSSFGLGGSNAHVVLQEAPAIEPTDDDESDQLIVLSAKTATALETATQQLAVHLQANPDLNVADVAHTLQVGRQPFAHRRLLTAVSVPEAITKLQQADYATNHIPWQSGSALTFVCTGLGIEVNTARELYDSIPVFAEEIEACAALLRPYLGIDIRTVLYPNNPEADGALSPQPVAAAAAFAVEFALAKTWQAWGVLPESLLGIGRGEITAAVLSGALSLADGARLAAAGDLLAFQAEHVHAEQGDIPVFSAQAGKWMSVPDYTPHYWGHLAEGSKNGHLAKFVTTALEQIQQQPARLLLSLGQWAPLPHEQIRVPHFKSIIADEALSAERMQQLLGDLWLAGTAVSWDAVYADEPRRRIVLPTYPFERKRYWIEPGNTAAQQPATLHKNTDMTQWGYAPSWQSTAGLPPYTPPQTAVTWLIFGDSELAPVLTAQLQANGQQVITVKIGEAWGQEGYNFTVNPDDASQYTKLLAELPALPAHILFLWGMELAAPFYALAYLAQAVGALAEPVNLHIVTRHACAVMDGEDVSPQQAALLGLTQTMPQEYAHTSSHLIDITEINTRTVQQILAECTAVSLTPQIALRSRQRWVQTVTPAPLHPCAAAPFKESGTYVITGGLSDIGFDIARTLAEQSPLKLILLDEAAADETQLELLQATGAQVAAFQVDLTDVDGLKTAVSQGIEQFGQITAVIHSPTVAGQQSFQAIAEISPTHSDIFFQTKLATLEALAKIIADMPLEFCMVSSALSTVLGGVGFAAFTAAAHSTNTAVQRLNQTSAFPWIALNWDVWAFEEESMTPVLGNLAQLALNRHEGLSVLERVAAAPDAADVLFISTADLPQRIASRQQKAAPSDQNMYERPNLWTEYVAPRNEIEERVVTIWQQVLGIEKIGVQDNFFDLGGHSLLATQLRNQLLNEFQVELSLQQLFTNATAAGVAEGIAAGLAAGVNNDKPILQQLKEAFPVERPSLVENYLRQKIAYGLNISPAEIPANGDLSGFDMQLAGVDLMWNLKRDMKVQFYPHEILGAPDLPTLAQFVYQQQDRMANLPAYATDKPLSAYTIKEHRDDTYQRAPFVPPQKKNNKMLFILSSPRSGSTLFRVMLAGHQQIFCPPEISLLFFKDMQEWQQNVSFGQDFTWPAEGLHWALVELMNLEPEEGWALIEKMVAENHTVPDVYNRIQTLAGDRLLVDKTPPYAMDMETLVRAEQIFEDAVYIHLVRHPYAMMESFLRVRLDQQFSSSLFDEANPDPYIIAETIWATANRNLLTFLQDVDPARHRLVRYEDLVQQPETTMREVCDLLSLRYDPALITPYDGRRERMMGGIGDPNILTHTGIDPALGDAWQKVTLPRRLDPTTKALAEQLGYDLPDNYKAPEGERPYFTQQTEQETAVDDIDIASLSDADVEAMLSQLLKSEEG